jgi:hypothetical protein
MRKCTVRSENDRATEAFVDKLCIECVPGNFIICLFLIDCKFGCLITRTLTSYGRRDETRATYKQKMHVLSSLDYSTDNSRILCTS